MTATIFDIDGTLTETTQVDDKCFVLAFTKVFGIDISNQDWSEYENVTDWGITEEIISKKWNRKPIKAEFEKMELEFVKLLKKELQENKVQFKEINGATNFIGHLNKKTDKVIGIATGGWERPATLKLNAIGIEPVRFAFSNSSRFKEREKILSDTISQIIEIADKPIERIIYFGDGIWDFLTCQKLGIDFIGIDYKENGKLKKIGAKNIFKDYEQPELINNFL
ncbi:MAG: HAD family hydrolase [Algicola sp.]|nr:HAD family hydrolase [Algicola sp.]